MNMNFNVVNILAFLFLFCAVSTKGKTNELLLETTVKIADTTSLPPEDTTQSQEEEVSHVATILSDSVMVSKKGYVRT